MTSPRFSCTLALLGALVGCDSGAPGPAPLDTRNERCGSCHMAVSDVRTAGQIVAAGEEPIFFDDLGCLTSYLAASKNRLAGAAVFVADHRTRAWVPAATAVYTRTLTLETPMGSHLVAHADPDSQHADADARGGVSVTWAALLEARGEGR
jgi:copper chaperone NosL